MKIYIQLKVWRNSAINVSSDVEEIDPNGDDWDYIEGSSNYQKSMARKEMVQGLEFAGGKYPDSEDLDNSGFLDRLMIILPKQFP